MPVSDPNKKVTKLDEEDQWKHHVGKVQRTDLEGRGTCKSLAWVNLRADTIRGKKYTYLHDVSSLSL